MRLQNGLEITQNRAEETIKFSKIINNKLRWLETKCKTINMLMVLAKGYESYSDEQFLAEVEATKN